MKNFILAIGLALTLSTLAVAQPAAINLGSLPEIQTADGFLAVGQVAWYRFELDNVDASDWFLDITTNFADDDQEVTDTELALYAGNGRLITSAGEDDGFGLQSTLSFGTGSGRTLGDSFNLGGDGVANGEHGPREAGTHYVAVSGFETTFGDNWQAVSNSQLTGTYQVTFYTTNAVPEPATAMLLLGLLGLLALRRRAADC